MTHDELLAKIESDQEDYYANHRHCNALRAVVELHKPTKERSVEPLCDVCEHYWAWPCPTIQAIEKELQ